jgi:hypothetical protein
MKKTAKASPRMMKGKTKETAKKEPPKMPPSTLARNKRLGMKEM